MIEKNVDLFEAKEVALAKQAYAMQTTAEDTEEKIDKLEQELNNITDYENQDSAAPMRVSRDNKYDVNDPEFMEQKRQMI